MLSIVSFLLDVAASLLDQQNRRKFVARIRERKITTGVNVFFMQNAEKFSSVRIFTERSQIVFYFFLAYMNVRSQKNLIFLGIEECFRTC